MPPADFGEILPLAANESLGEFADFESHHGGEFFNFCIGKGFFPELSVAGSQQCVGELLLPGNVALGEGKEFLSAGVEREASNLVSKQSKKKGVGELGIENHGKGTPRVIGCEIFEIRLFA